MIPVPVVINNFNRYEPFLKLVEWLKSLPGIGQIIVCDNASTFPPLLDFYKRSSDLFKLVRYDYNGGHNMPKHVLKDLRITEGRVIVTDPDLVPYPNTPTDIVSKFHSLMDANKNYEKVGCGLGIDDLPPYYPFADRVRKHELALLGKSFPDGSREACIDTTFCMYRSPTMFGSWQIPAIRTSKPYILKHVDWYVNPRELTEEYCWYLSNCTKSASYAGQLKDWYYLHKMDYRTKVVSHG